MTNEIELDQELNATQLDAQRARQLLNRALGLSERGDLAGAIVTCRQSLVLSPNSPQGWSMLGLLHERDGDIHGAIEAYEKTLQLSPGSILERESLQRLRQKRGAAPRPAPKFHFDEISNGAPQVPLSPASQPSIPQQIITESFDAGSSASLWDTFYFRSLPVLITVVACLGLMLVAQRVAANRQEQNVQNMPAPPANMEATPTVPAQPDTPIITPSTLAPPTAPATETGRIDSPETSSTETPRSAPIVAPKSTEVNKPKQPKPISQSKPAPRPPVPSEMPVLPAPRLTLPKRSAPAPAVPDGDTNDNAPTIGGGPLDVGNSDNSKYIPINPPHFPNANRN